MMKTYESSLGKLTKIMLVESSLSDEYLQVGAAQSIFIVSKCTYVFIETPNYNKKKIFEFIGNRVLNHSEFIIIENVSRTRRMLNQCELMFTFFSSFGYDVQFLYK